MTSKIILSKSPINLKSLQFLKIWGLSSKRCISSSKLVTDHDGEELKKLVELKRNELQSAYADLQNLREGAWREAENARQFALQNFAKTTLAVADTFQRASIAVQMGFANIDKSKDSAGAKPFLESLLEDEVKMIEEQLVEVFKQIGVAKYYPLSPAFHLKRLPDNYAVVLKHGSRQSWHDAIRANPMVFGWNMPYRFDVSLTDSVSYLFQIPLREEPLPLWIVHNAVVRIDTPGKLQLDKEELKDLLMTMGLFSFCKQFMPNLFNKCDSHSWKLQYDKHGGIPGYLLDPTLYFRGLKEITYQLLALGIDQVLRTIIQKPTYQISQLAFITRDRLGVHCRPRVRKGKQKGGPVVFQGISVSLNNDSKTNLYYEGYFLKKGQTIHIPKPCVS